MVRVRFAPSPTGPLHIGGVRTALYNYFFAKKNNGKIILRIEDTDQTRFVEGAEQYIIDSLNWAGIKFDEGPHIGGEYGPYRQSDRKELYKKYVDFLIDNDFAYYAFDTADDLNALRKAAEAEKKTFQYDYTNRNTLNNSLSMTADEIKTKLSSGEHYTVRLKVPADINVTFHDLIRGDVTIHTSNVDDKIIFKSDGMPTYHLANIVDDHLMKITHVIRGEEWLPSAPLHVLMYKFFDWEAPQFAHLPLLLKPDGKGKLSKRDGDKLGFPVFPMQFKDPKTGEHSSGYKESGYFPEAFINMLAFLGWNPGDEREIMSMEEMTDAFSLERVSKSGARFDAAKTRWFNHEYLQKRTAELLLDEYERILAEKGITSQNKDYEKKVISMVKERADFVEDIVNCSLYFYAAPEEYDEKSVKKHWTENTKQYLEHFTKIFENINTWSVSELENIVQDEITKNEMPAGKIYNAIRISIVGSSSGPHLFDIMEMLGKEESLSRISRCMQKINM